MPADSRPLPCAPPPRRECRRLRRRSRPADDRLRKDRRATAPARIADFSGPAGTIRTTADPHPARRQRPHPRNRPRSARTRSNGRSPARRLRARHGCRRTETVFRRICRGVSVSGPTRSGKRQKPPAARRRPDDPHAAELHPDPARNGRRKTSASRHPDSGNGTRGYGRSHRSGRSAISTPRASTGLRPSSPSPNRRVRGATFRRTRWTITRSSSTT